MNWEKKISKLDCPEIKRLRQSTSNYTLPRFREIPLDKPLPQHKGNARMLYPTDSLYVIGMNKYNRVKKVCCGLFSEELLNRVRQQIKANQSSEPTLKTPADSVDV